MREMEAIVAVVLLALAAGWTVLALTWRGDDR